MDRGDLAVADADCLVQHLDHRREAVVVQDAAVSRRLFARLVAMVVDADDDVERAGFLHRRGDDHPLHAAREIPGQLLLLEELAGAFQHDIATQIAQATPSAVGAALKPMRRFADDDRAIALDAEALAPTAVTLSNSSRWRWWRRRL